MWKIADIEIENSIVVGPMAGISNSAFREIAYQFGAGLIYTEMISDKAIYYGNIKTIAMTNITPQEGLVSMQLFGNEVESMVYAAKHLDANTNCAIIDINMGCPVPKVIKNGAGCALMKNPDLAYEIVRSIKQAISKPLTVKMRIGWDTNSINGLQFAQLMEKAGADGLAVHGRLRSQYYDGKANWDIIKEIKEKTTIPIIGNGDIKTVKDVLDKLAFSGCDAVMLSRGVLGNPWLIKQAVTALNDNNEDIEISIDKKFAVARSHAERLIELKKEAVAIKEMRGHAGWYIHGLPFNNQIKDKLNKMTTYQQFDTILKDYSEQLSKMGEPIYEEEF